MHFSESFFVSIIIITFKEFWHCPNKGQDHTEDSLRGFISIGSWVERNPIDTIVGEERGYKWAVFPGSFTMEKEKLH